MENECGDIGEDDVIIEGSELHKALTDMGCTDFECTKIRRSEIYEQNSQIDDHKKVSSNIQYEWLWKFIRRLDKCWVYKSKKRNFQGVRQLQIISQLDPLLDDHSVMIQNMLKGDVITERRRNIPKWPIFIVSNSILATSVYLYKSFKTPGLAAISSIVALMAYHTYNKSHSVKNLKELISVQNDMYYLYKRILKLLKNSSYFKSSHRQSQKSLNDLEIKRIKYLQPMCEHFVQSMEKITKICYHMSLLLGVFVDQTYKHYCTANLITKFDETTFIFEGEITYEKLKKHYYIYILVQSEMMQILAILYQDGLIGNHIDLQLMSIIKSLLQFFEVQKIKLSDITEQYKSFKALSIHHKLNNIIGTKLQDLYLHVDLLARKILSIYDLIISTVDDIDDCKYEDSEGKIIELISGKMNEVYKEIDTARNFAEFNNLLIGKLRQNKIPEIDNTLNARIVNEIEKILPIVHDTDPQIIDEVFEEYIKDEYFKSLYEDNDVDSLERGKLDKLLAKNFMSELKEVLIDKYKIMSEREAKALQSYRNKIHKAKQDDDNDNYGEKDSTNLAMLSPPPPPPPPPLSEPIDEINLSQSKKIKIRTPVPLPRSANAMCSWTEQRRKISQDLESEIVETKEKFLMNMDVDIRRIKLSTFMNNEETFIGSGENSDEEIIVSNESENEKLLALY